MSNVTWLSRMKMDTLSWKMLCQMDTRSQVSLKVFILFSCLHTSCHMVMHSFWQQDGVHTYQELPLDCHWDDARNENHPQLCHVDLGLCTESLISLLNRAPPRAFREAVLWLCPCGRARSCGWSILVRTSACKGCQGSKESKGSSKIPGRICVDPKLWKAILMT